MKRLLMILLALWLTCSGLSGIQAQTLDFERYDPPSTLKVPENLVYRAKFPFIDVHNHQWDMPRQDLKKLVQEMDSLNMGVLVNLSGRGFQDAGDGHLRQSLENVQRNFPQRFIIFTNVDFEGVGSTGWAEKAVKTLREDVKAGAKGLKVYKSLGFTVKDTAGKRVAVDDPRLDPIWAACGELGVPVLVHSADPEPFWDAHNEENERWLELKTHPRRKRSDVDPAPWEQIIAEQHRVFKKHANTTFISAHFSWLANDLTRLGQLLDEMPNVQVEFGAVIAELGRQPRFAKAFFIKYQDRILFGKDSYKPEEYPTYFRVLETEDEYFPYYKKYHAYWKMYGLGLPDEVLKKVYYKNALRIIPGIDKIMFPG